MVGLEYLQIFQSVENDYNQKPKIYDLSHNAVSTEKR